ncbi:MAG: hypothetical protein ABTQ31_07130 [Rhizobiaceae bacterium]
MERFWHKVFFPAALALAVSPAAAAQRYDISTMSCAEVQAVIDRDGEAILGSPSKSILGLSRYDRYVRDRKFCATGEVLRRTGVATSDQKFCPVNKCVESDIFVSD